jgi:lipoprotein-anchoring transpeptidase ErfK/SrfK
MIRRQPELAKWAEGQPGGPKNPLGARAIYLHRNGVDTGYRIHGTPEWSSIGRAASSGCIRMINQDVIDLYGRVRKGAKVIVR